MKRFLYKAFFYVLILILLDRCFIFFKEDDHNLFAEIAVQKMQKASTILKQKNNPDVIFVGSSHAQFGFSPEVVKEQLQVASFNLAYGGGSNIGLQLALLKKLLAQTTYRPKAIVYGIDVFTLNAAPKSGDPFQEVLFDEKKSFWKSYDRYFYSYFKLYAPNIPTYFKHVAKGDLTPLFLKKSYYDLSMFDKYEKYEISATGWVKADGILNKKYLRFADIVFNPDPKAVLLLNEYIDLCAEKNIALLLVQIPEHSTSLVYSKKYLDFNAWMQKLVSKKNVQYLDYDNAEKFPVDQDSLFFDTDHLNVEGANMFTARFCPSLRSFLNNTSQH